MRYVSYSITISLLLLFTASTNKAIAQCDNIALGKPVTGSSLGYGGTVLGDAIDGNCSSSWNSGWYAPQFIEIDLLGTYTINNINIIFDMLPDGDVNHEILTSADMVNWTVVDVIAGFYGDGQLIERCYNSSPLTNVSGIRISSISSPSWIAISELGVYTSSAPTNPTITASGPLTFCEGDSVTLTSSTAFAYSWSNGATAQSITVNSPGIYSVTTSEAPSCVQGTVACTTCGVGTASATVSVNQPITPTFTAVAPFCSGATLTALPTISNNGITGTWSPALNNTATTIYTFTPTAGQCATITTSTITLIPNIEISISALQNPICAGDSTTLTADGATSYLWSNGQTTPSINISSAGTYQVTGTNTQTGCSGEATFSANLIPLPRITLPETAFKCVGSSIIAMAETSVNGHFLWNTGSESPFISIDEPGTYFVVLTYVCGELTATIDVFDKDCSNDLFIPNAFTPNGDGINDLFRASSQNIMGFEMRVFSRYGELVFYTDNILNGWNGSMMNSGYYCQAGVYAVLYKAQFNGMEIVERTGHVVLVR